MAVVGAECPRPALGRGARDPVEGRGTRGGVGWGPWEGQGGARGGVGWPGSRWRGGRSPGEGWAGRRRGAAGAVLLGAGQRPGSG